MRTTAGGALFRDNKVLLGLRSARKSYYPNKWDIFGGHLELAETPEAALCREIGEELGVVLTAYDRVAILPEPNVAAYGPAWHHVYVIHRWTGTPTNLSDEHARVGWFDLDRLSTLDLVSPDYAAILSPVGRERSARRLSRQNLRTRP